MARRKALITGITGQDGYYLTRLLLDKGYEVHGIKRRLASIHRRPIDDFYQDPHLEDTRLFLHYGDSTDIMTLTSVLTKVKPQEIYNFAAQSHVRVSFDVPIHSSETNAIGALNILEAIRQSELAKETKFYQASSSEMFGATPPPQNENSPFYPLSPYAASKVFAYWATVNYREAHGLFASNGILFNHESPIRGETFVTRKLAISAAKISRGIQDCVYLGNLEAKRDWGHAKDYVRGIYQILQHDKPDDFVLATGRSETIRFFAERTFEFVDIDIEWQGKGEQEVGINKKNGKTIIRIDPRYFRPTEVESLRGDATKAKTVLNWKLDFTLEQLVEEMVRAEIQKLDSPGPQ